MNKLSVIIGADLVPTKTNEELFINGKIEELFGDKLIELIRNCDIKIFNLEAPLIEKHNPIIKCGPILGANINSISAIKKLEPTYLNIVNNHIMDHNIAGLNSTIKVLNENNIGYSGIGKNIEDVQKFWTIKKNDITVGIYTCAEHEFSIATHNKAGVLPYDEFNSYDDIRIYSGECDILIVLYHGGKEYYQYPSPKLKLRCEKFIDSGANLVVCQHSHCIGCEEDYKNGKIIYGQGNFIFDDGTDNVLWENGLLLKFDIAKDKKITDYKYYVIQRENNTIRLAADETTKEILNGYFSRSNNVFDDKLLSKKYNDYAQKELYTILRKYDWFSSTIFMRLLNKISKGFIGKFYFEKIYLPKKACDLLNGIECECWSEVTITLLKNYIER